MECHPVVFTFLITVTKYMAKATDPCLPVVRTENSGSLGHRETQALRGVRYMLIISVEVIFL